MGLIQGENELGIFLFCSLNHARYAETRFEGCEYPRRISSEFQLEKEPRLSRAFMRDCSRINSRRPDVSGVKGAERGGGFFPRRAPLAAFPSPLSEPVVSDIRGVARGDKGNRIVSSAKGIDGARVYSTRCRSNRLRPVNVLSSPDGSAVLVHR